MDLAIVLTLPKYNETMSDIINSQGCKTNIPISINILSIIGAICSIAGVVIMLFSNKDIAIIALVCVIIALLVVITCIYIYFRQYLKQERSYLDQFIAQEYPKEFLKLSFFTTYKQINNTRSEYDGYRIIQSKRPELKEVPWGIKWSGSKLPKVSSTLQGCNELVNPKTNNYDEVVLRLKKPLKYNETTELHLHAEMDDIDGTAQPYLEAKIESPDCVVHFRVILCNKGSDYNANANLKRMPIQSGCSPLYETVETIPFNTITHSYEHVLNAPETGYYYRLEWEK